jgi:dolichol-phosphate mannosyltransferase
MTDRARQSASAESEAPPAPSPSQAASGTTLSVVLPTYNEQANIRLAIERIDKALAEAVASIGLVYEIIVVDDDSPDRTWEVVEGLVRTRDNLHLIRRIGRRGLSSAVIEGFQSGNGRLLAVMDADLQHDATILGTMTLKALDAGADLVVATRYAKDGGTGDWNFFRKLLSRIATLMSRLVMRTRVSDPMSGYFLVTAKAFAAVSQQVNQRGFKILLEILARSPPLAAQEVPYVFTPRLHGESKLDSGVGIAYLRALYDLSFGKVIPLRFLLYCMVGASGVVVNLGVLWLLRGYFKFDQHTSLLAAIATSILSNYLLNNFITFSDRKRSGMVALTGLALFCLVSSGGALINYSVSTLFASTIQMNIYVADLLGIVLATIWNYTLNRLYTWQKRAS